MGQRGRKASPPCGQSPASAWAWSTCWRTEGGGGGRGRRARAEGGGCPAGRPWALQAQRGPPSVSQARFYKTDLLTMIHIT